MRSFSYRNDPQALEDFLYDLACDVKHPEQSDLLIEMLMWVERPLDKVRDDRWSSHPD